MDLRKKNSMEKILKGLGEPCDVEHSNSRTSSLSHVLCTPLLKDHSLLRVFHIRPTIMVSAKVYRWMTDLDSVATLITTCTRKPQLLLKEH
jgi:hypothetical protein